MMSAIASAQQGNKVTLIEKMNSLGRKLLITGKGRCNITSSINIEDFIKNIPRNGKFLYSSFINFSNLDIIEFLRKQGLEVKIERGNRIFPVTDSSQDVLKCFTKKLKDLKVNIMLNTKVKHIIINKEKNCVEGVKLEDENIIKAEKIIFTGLDILMVDGYNNIQY